MQFGLSGGIVVISVGRNKISRGDVLCGWLVVQQIKDSPEDRKIEWIARGHPDPRECEKMVRSVAENVEPADQVEAVRPITESELEDF
jgi:hypothetical protein